MTYSNGLLLDATNWQNLKQKMNKICNELRRLYPSLSPFSSTVRTLPVSDTSPVMATFCLTGRPVARERRAETIVTPALGPSFGVAP